MSSSIKYTPFSESYLVRIPFEKFAWGTVSLPLFAFTFCVVWSIIYNFEEATFTHCHVYNFLPSISAAIGSFSTQKRVWQFAIGLHALPRIGIALMYQKLNSEILTSKGYILSFLPCAFNVIENVSLVGLSFWTSSESYGIHKLCFVTFILMSLLYMMFVCMLHTKCQKKPFSKILSKSLKSKRRILFLNISCILTAAYFFQRHNSLCEPKVYSVFAFFEYIVVLTNMGFHMTAYWDFYGRDFVIGSTGMDLLKS